MFYATSHLKSFTVLTRLTNTLYLNVHANTPAYTRDRNQVSFLDRPVCNSWCPRGLIIFGRILLTKTDTGPQRCPVSFQTWTVWASSQCVCVCCRCWSKVGPIILSRCWPSACQLSLEGGTCFSSFAPQFHSPPFLHLAVFVVPSSSFRSLFSLLSCFTSRLTYARGKGGGGGVSLLNLFYSSESFYCC